MSQQLFLSGDEALAQGAYDAGLMVAASYPGTPATEILEYLTQFKDIQAQWSVNEKVAYEVALGSAWGGVRSMFSAKHVGLNVAMDPLMTSIYTGVNAGFLAVSCDDPGLHSSQNEQDNRYIARFAKMPLIEPASPAEAYRFAGAGFTISEQFDIPVLVRMTTRIAHTKENVIIGERTTVAKKPFGREIPKYVMVPSNAYKRHILLEEKLLQLKAFAETTELNTIEWNSKKLGIITSGVTYLYAKEMYPDASFLKLGFSYPLPIEKIKAFAAQVEDCFVLEELEPLLEDEIARHGIRSRGKHPSYRVGEIRPEHIPAIIENKPRTEHPKPGRKPVFCPGCGHRPVFVTLKKMKLTVVGDIGCYALGASPPLSTLHTCLDMGSGVTLLEGFIKAGEQNVVGVIGDSTFMHSGITGLINMNYNQTKGVLIILDNGTTAMTGSQPHPATGKTAQGANALQVKIEDICKASGAENIDIINPFSPDFEKTLKKRLTEPKLSVIIARYPCRLIDKTKKQIPTYIKEVCAKCKSCTDIDCPAITKVADGTVSLNTDMCTGCDLCVTVCKVGGLKQS
jgi:indolepyruvate ferredoxin oxidoreductase alpha subunit